MKIWKYAVRFYVGGSAYLFLELLFRGRSYGSMFLAGGVCFLLVGHLGEVRPRLPVPARALVGAGIITMVELAAGMLVNRDYRVWDYRGVPMNFMGQICPRFTALWIPVALAAIWLYGPVRDLTEKETPAG